MSHNPVRAVSVGLSRTTWTPSPTVTHMIGPPGRWLVIGEGDGTAGVVCAALRAANATTAVIDCTLDDGGQARLGEEFLQLDKLLADEFFRGILVIAGAPDRYPDASDPYVHYAETARSRTLRLTTVSNIVASAGPRSPRLWVITCGAVRVLPDDEISLGQAALVGLANAVCAHSADLRVIVVDNDPSWSDYADLADLLLTGDPPGAAGGGVVALRRGVVYKPLTVPVAPRCSVPEPSRAEVADSTQLIACQRRDPGANEVELRVIASGLNHEDTRSVDSRQEHHIGMDCAGVVARTGKNVTSVSEGDLVAAIGAGTCSSYVTLSADLVVHAPSRLSMIEVAALPVPYVKTWLALFDIGGLTAGELLVVRSATNGLGAAAAAIGVSRGFGVMAIADSDEERAMFERAGVQHVLKNDDNIVPRILALTGGNGADVFIDSRFDRAVVPVDALRTGGRLIDLCGNEANRPWPREDILVGYVNLRMMLTRMPYLVGRTLSTVIELVEQGKVPPIRCASVPVANASKALQKIATGASARAVVAIPCRSQIRLVRTKHSPTVQQGGGYIVSTGSDGFGLTQCRWLSERGARRVVISASDALEFREADQLRLSGIEVEVVVGDLAVAGVAEELIAATTRGGVRLCGVLHNGQDTADGWQSNVVAVWRLHEATLGHALDWFVLCSSGEAGYTAAATNSWRDGFAAWRSARGLPGLSVVWSSCVDANAAARVGVVEAALTWRNEENDAPLMSCRVS